MFNTHLRCLYYVIGIRLIASDIDECGIYFLCPEDLNTCINTYGGYECLQLVSINGKPRGLYHRRYEHNISSLCKLLILSFAGEASGYGYNTDGSLTGVSHSSTTHQTLTIIITLFNGLLFTTIAALIVYKVYKSFKEKSTKKGKAHHQTVRLSEHAHPQNIFRSTAYLHSKETHA